MDDATSDSWSASTLSVRDTLRDAVAGANAESAPEAAVATVVGVEGSAYRRPGAKRVLGAGEAVGAITAGCLEGPVADLADRALADGPLCEMFDLTGDDDAWGFGLGCNGVVDVLVEPADASFRPALERVADGERVALLTVVGGDHPRAPTGARAFVRPRDRAGARASADARDRASANARAGSETTNARPPIPDDVLRAVREQAIEFAVAGRSDTLTVETERGTAEVFVDGLAPVSELLIFGHTPDVRPVARLARDAGFRVTVATARGARADADEFPSAHEVVAVRPPEVADALARPEDAYVVLMSHNFVDDRLALESVLETEVAYVGLMGPRKRFEQMRDALAESGRHLSETELARISTPIGLDLGGGDPPRIALSIVSEVLAVSNDRDGGRLADGDGPIHPRSDSS